MADGLVRRDSLRLAPDTSRVITQLFVPGHALAGENEGRASGVVEHVLGLDDDEVTATLAAITARFDRRHRDLAGTFHHHFERIANRVAPGTELSAERRLLLGATFTHEYAVEAAALCNPSAVAAPDQSGARPGDLRFVMSVRQIGEGHRSSIGFRTGVVDQRGAVTIEGPGPFTTAGTVEHGTLDADLFRSLAHNGDAESTGWVLDGLGSRFTSAELDARLAELEAQHDTRRNVTETAHRLRQLASRSYDVQFPTTSTLGERVLVPATSAESNGMEDARFVRFVDDGGAVTYYATYTAFDGTGISQQLLATTDFRSFRSSPLLGDAAANKGLALFPRRINGRFAALSRHDGETERRRVLGRHPALADGYPDRDPHHGLGGGAESATAAHRSRSTRAGSCSPTASDRCARTRSARCSSTSTTRRPSSAGPDGHCWPRSSMSRTGTCRTSCTRAAPFATTISCSSRTASATPTSASPPSPSVTSSRRWRNGPPRRIAVSSGWRRVGRRRRRWRRR